MKKLLLCLCSIFLVVFIVLTIGFATGNFHISSKFFGKPFTPGATGKTAFDKVNDLEGVYLKTSKDSYPGNTQEISVVFHNDTDKEYIYGEKYYLEKYERGEWYRLSAAPSEYERAWNDIGYILEPDSEKEQKLNLEWIYGSNFDNGRYRIVKDIIYSRSAGDFDQYYLAVEFEFTDQLE